MTPAITDSREIGRSLFISSEDLFNPVAIFRQASCVYSSLGSRLAYCSDAQADGGFASDAPATCQFLPIPLAALVRLSFVKLTTFPSSASTPLFRWKTHPLRFRHLQTSWTRFKVQVDVNEVSGVKRNSRLAKQQTSTSFYSSASSFIRRNLEA